MKTKYLVLIAVIMLINSYQANAAGATSPTSILYSKDNGLLEQTKILTNVIIYKTYQSASGVVSPAIFIKNGVLSTYSTVSDTVTTPAGKKLTLVKPSASAKVPDTCRPICYSLTTTAGNLYYTYNPEGDENQKWGLVNPENKAVTIPEATSPVQKYSSPVSNMPSPSAAPAPVAAPAQPVTAPEVIKPVGTLGILTIENLKNGEYLKGIGVAKTNVYVVNGKVYDKGTNVEVTGETLNNFIKSMNTPAAELTLISQTVPQEIAAKAAPAAVPVAAAPVPALAPATAPASGAAVPSSAYALSHVASSDSGEIRSIGGALYFVSKDGEVSTITSSEGKLVYTPTPAAQIPPNLITFYGDKLTLKTATASSASPPLSTTTGRLKDGELMVSFLDPAGDIIEIPASSAISNNAVPKTVFVNGIELTFANSVLTGASADGKTTLTVTSSGSVSVEGATTTTTTINPNGGKTIEKVEGTTTTTRTLDAKGKETGKITQKKDAQGNVISASGTQTTINGKIITTTATECDKKGCILRTATTDANGKPIDTAKYCNTKEGTSVQNCKDELEKGGGKDCETSLNKAYLCKDAESTIYPGVAYGQQTGAATGKILFGATRYAALGNKLSSWMLPQGWLDWWQEWVSFEWATKWLNTDAWSSSICRVSSLQSDSEGVAVVYNVGATGESEAVISVQGMRIPIENAMNEAGVISTEYIYKMEFYVKNNDKNDIIMFMPKIVAPGKTESLFNTSIMVSKNRTANYRGDKMAVKKLKGMYTQLCLDFSIKPKGDLFSGDTVCADFVEPDESERGPVSKIVPETFPWEDEGDVLTQTAAATGTAVDPIAASQTQQLRNIEE